MKVLDNIIEMYQKIPKPDEIQIHPLTFRDLLVSECNYTKKEANEFVLMKMINQFGEVDIELKKILEEK